MERVIFKIEIEQIKMELFILNLIKKSEEDQTSEKAQKVKTGESWILE